MTLFQRREFAAKRAGLLEPRGGVAQESGDAEQGAGIAAKRENGELYRDLSAVRVEGRRRQ